MAKIAQDGWSYWITSSNGKFSGYFYINSVLDGDYHFFIYGKLKDILYTKDRIYPKEILNLYNHEVEVDHSFKNLILKNEKRPYVTTRAMLKKFFLSAIDNFNDNDKKKWTDSLGDNDEKILNSLIDSINKAYVKNYGVLSPLWKDDRFQYLVGILKPSFLDNKLKFKFDITIKGKLKDFIQIYQVNTNKSLPKLNALNEEELTITTDMRDSSAIPLKYDRYELLGYQKSIHKYFKSIINDQWIAKELGRLYS